MAVTGDREPRPDRNSVEALLGNFTLQPVTKPSRYILSSTPSLNMFTANLLQDRVVVITGGGSGLGQWFAKAFVEAGAKGSANGTLSVQPRSGDAQENSRNFTPVCNSLTF
ncbi:hypothetical protein B0H13DRAFT_1855913 [Mycena leptocephala]|nr:hypothetical protein B0H13DRAFT_1855913 [Mycena leptocephala]